MSSDLELPQNWHWETIDRLKASGRSIVSGPFGSNIGKRFFVEEGIPVIRGNNLSLGMERFNDGGFVFLTEEKAAEFKNCEAHPNDLLFTAAGTIGQVGIIPPRPRYSKYIISNKQLRARLDQARIQPLFAYYWLASPSMVAMIQNRNTGSTIPLINLSVLKSLPIPVPPMEEQDAIISVLSALDDRITLLRETNATLEAIAQALFKSWFVDFDPVHAKLQCLIPEGMDEATAALFPDSFEELGLVPRGWQSVTLGDVCKNNSVPFDFSKFEKVIFINTGDVFNGDFLHKNYSLKEGLPGQAKKAIFEDDILFSEIRPKNGRFAYVKFDARDYVVSTKFMVLRAINGIPPRYLYQVLRQTETIEYFNVIAESRSGTFPQITFDSVKNYKLLVPSNDCLNKYIESVSPIFSKIDLLNEQTKNLAAIRDTLLPRLISGQLRITDQEGVGS